MNTSQYEALVQACESGTLTQAAEILGYTQSGLTRALNALEDQFNLRLLQRDRKGVQLTNEGKMILPHIKNVLRDQYALETIVHELNGLKAGLIRIGTFNSVSAQWLPGIIKAYHADYPAIRFELLHGTNTQIEEWLHSGRIDIGLVKYPTDTKLDADFLLRDPIVSIFSQEDPHAQWKVFPIQELLALTYISLNEGVEDEITTILEANGIKPDAEFIEGDDHAVIAMVEAGLGTSLMSRLMLQGFSRKITAIPIDPPGYRDLGIACKNKTLLSKASRKFMDYTWKWICAKYGVPVYPEKNL